MPKNFRKRRNSRSKNTLKSVHLFTGIRVEEVMTQLKCYKETFFAAKYKFSYDSLTLFSQFSNCKLYHMGKWAPKGNALKFHDHLCQPWKKVMGSFFFLWWEEFFWGKIGEMRRAFAVIKTRAKKVMQQSWKLLVFSSSTKTSSALGHF